MFWNVRAIPSPTRLCTGVRARSSPRNRIVPEVSGKRPLTRLTVVLLPDPLGPISPTISPSATVRSSPSTARTPPKWREARVSSSMASRAEEASHARKDRGVDQAVRPEIHGEDDQRTEEQIAPVAEKAQPLDQESLHEDHRREGAEYAREPADDGVGDGERGDEDVEARMLDMRRVVGVQAAADAGDRAADGHRAHLHRGEADADRLCRELVLADRAEHGPVARAIEPPEQRHRRGDDGPDEQHHFERRPAMLGEVADLAEPFPAERSDLDVAAGDLVVEVEEEEPHALAERERGDDEHQAVDPQRGKAHSAGDDRAEESADAERRDEWPAEEDGEHARCVGADREEPRLRKAHLPGEQHDVGRQSEQRMDPDDLREAVVEVHRRAGLQPRPPAAPKIPCGRKTRNANSSSIT